MKKRRFISIRAKLAFAFLFVYLVPVVAVLLLLSRQLEGTFDKIALPRLKSAIASISADFEKIKKSTVEQTGTLAQSRPLVEAAAVYNEWPGELTEEVEGLGRNTPLDFLRVVDRRGRILASTPNKGEINDVIDDPMIAAAFMKKSGLSVRMEKAARTGGARAVSLNAYYPIIYRDGAAAVLIGGKLLDKDYLKELYSISNARVRLFREGELVEAFPPDEGASRIGAGFLKAIKANPQHTETFSSKGKEYMLGALPMRIERGGEAEAVFVLDLSREQVNTVLEKTLRNVIVLALFGFGLSAALGAVFSLGFTRHISQLARSAQLIGGGRFLEAHNSVTARDEIGILAEAMNKMVGDLKEYSEKLAMTERVAAWREIARRIAHEIKNPISPIQLSIENLKAAFSQDRGQFDEVFPECAETILEEVDKLKKLANEFSEFARLPRPNFEKIDIIEVLENVVNLHSAGAAGVSAVFKDGGERPLYIRGDRDQLNRVFTNLVKNAVEAMPGGGELKVIVRRHNDEIFIVIEDTGVGMDREDLQKIFTPYFTTKQSGSGLGLSIVQRILQDHDAGIDVYSEKGAGTKFILAFKELDERAAARGDNDG